MAQGAVSDIEINPTVDEIAAPPPTPDDELETIPLKKPSAANDQPEPVMVELDDETMQKAAEPVPDIIAELTAKPGPAASESDEIIESAKKAVVEAKREVDAASKTVEKSKAAVKTATKESEAAATQEISAKAKVETTAVKLSQAQGETEKAALKQELIQQKKEVAIAAATKEAAEVTKQEADKTLTEATKTKQMAEAKKELGTKAVEIVKAAAAKKVADEKSMYLLEKLAVTTKSTFGDLCLGPVRDPATNGSVMAVCLKTGPKNTCPTTFSEGSCIRLQTVSSDVLGMNVVKKW